MISTVEEVLFAGFDQSDLPPVCRQYQFDTETGKGWLFDFAWPEIKIAVEVEGGIWKNGAHNRGKGFTKDCEKYNAAVLQGWHLLRFTTDMVYQGIALRDTRRLYYGLSGQTQAEPSEDGDMDFMALAT